MSHDRTLTVFEWYFADPGTPESWNSLQAGIEFSDEVQREDVELCESVWRNLQVGVYNQGRYSILRENGACARIGFTTFTNCYTSFWHDNCDPSCRFEGAIRRYPHGD